VKISCKADVHIFHTNFAKKWNELCMKQLAGRKHMENDCFPRTLKFGESPNSKKKQPKSLSNVDGPGAACEEESTIVMYKCNKGDPSACTYHICQVTTIDF
jgi:hypothetical protein